LASGSFTDNRDGLQTKPLTGRFARAVGW